MARFKNHLLVVVGFAIAGMIGAAFGSGTAQAIVSTLVTIVNTAVNPVQTQHVPADNPATQAVSLICNINSFIAQQTECFLINGSLSNPSYVVPSGKRLVVESISGNVQFATNANGIPLIGYYVSDNQQNYHFYPPLNFVATGAGIEDYSFGLSVRLYAEQGTNIFVAVEAGTVENGSFYAFGHLEDIQ